MQKIDRVVIKETAYIAAWVLIFSALMQAVFLLIGKWDWTVLLGNILSGAVTILNFFLLGLTVQKAVTKEEKEAKGTLKLSQTLRFLMLVVVAVLGVVLPCFNIYTTLIPFLFPRVAIALRPLVLRGKDE